MKKGFLMPSHGKMTDLPASASASASAKTEKKENVSTHRVWLEKYRPSSLDDVVGNQDFIHQLKVLRFDPSRMTNFILAGLF